MNRNVLVGAVVGGMVVAAGIGWVLGSQIRSPAELAAAASPPTPSNITVPVVRQTLSADVITRGEVVYDEPVQIGLSGSFADQPERLLATATVEVDAQLEEGDLAVEVVGRPVFLLQGDIPAFRDLRPGASGVDVLQLEQALARLGYFDGTPDEDFDTATGAAIADWYQDRGYTPNGASPEDEAGIAAARDRVRAAEAALAGSSEESQSARLQARSEVDAAVAALELAELDANRANVRAKRAVEVAKEERDDAARRLKQAEAGTNPETGEAPTSAELSALRREARDAEAAHGDAAFEVERTAKEQASMVAQARDRVAIARASLAELDSGGGTDDQALQEELAAAQEELAELRAASGTWLPAGEFVFLSSLPVRVDQVSIARGSPIEGSFLTVSGSELTMRSHVHQRDAGLLSIGTPVEIEDPEGGAPLEGTLTQIADRPGTHNVPSDRVFIEIEPDDLPSELIGMSVRVTIPVSSTAGEVLAVPAAALSATAAGKTIVQVDESDGSLRTVEVTTGLATGGLVEVTPVGGRLDEGDLVVVGREDGRPVEIDEVGDDPDAERDDDPVDDPADTPGDAPAEDDGGSTGLDQDGEGPPDSGDEEAGS